MLTENCSADKFFDYFKSIHSFSHICHDNEFTNQMEEHLDNTETLNNDTNSLLTEQEIEKAIYQLKIINQAV